MRQDKTAMTQTPNNKERIRRDIVSHAENRKMPQTRKVAWGAIKLLCAVVICAAMLCCFGISAVAADETTPAPAEDTAPTDTAVTVERTLSKVQLEDLAALISSDRKSVV